MIIRELKQEEIALAVELRYQCWSNDFEGIIPKDSMDIDEEMLIVYAWINNKNSDDIRHLYGAFEGDDFLGYIGASPAELEDCENGVELYYLFVKKEYRGKMIGLKLIRAIAAEYIEYGAEQLIVYNWHESQSNRFYRNIGGKVQKQVTKILKGEDVLVDVFIWDINILIKFLNDKLYSLCFDKDGFAYQKLLSDSISLTTTHTDEDRNSVCKGLFQHNVRKTNGLLKNPNVDINLYLKDGDKPIGAILCDTFNLCIYIDVMWIDEAYRGRGFGKALISQAEYMAKNNGCLFSHTCTFSYQSPEFYKACGYSVFAELDDYTDGIIQYFLKKKL